MSEYVSFIRFRVHTGRDEEFLQAFQACGMLTRPREIDGFLSAELLFSRDDPTRFAVVGRWRTPAAYQAWQTISRCGAPADALLILASCLHEAVPGELYEIA